jgi:uncharacterized protein YciI
MKLAGPLLFADDGTTWIGSCLIVEAPSKEDAIAFNATILL